MGMPHRRPPSPSGRQDSAFVGIVESRFSCSACRGIPVQHNQACRTAGGGGVLLIPPRPQRWGSRSNAGGSRRCKCLPKPADAPAADAGGSAVAAALQSCASRTVQGVPQITANAALSRSVHTLCCCCQPLTRPGVECRCLGDADALNPRSHRWTETRRLALWRRVRLRFRRWLWHGLPLRRGLPLGCSEGSESVIPQLAIQQLAESRIKLLLARCEFGTRALLARLQQMQVASVRVRRMLPEQHLRPCQ